MKIFLAGATGAIGRLLLPLLVKAGYDVAGTTRSEARTGAILAAGGRPVVVDALDRDALFAALAAEGPDVVISQVTDLAGRDYAANTRLRVEGSRNLVDAAKAAGVTRMIAESIGWVYASGSGPASEDERLDVDGEPPHSRAAAAVHALETAVAEMPTGIMLRYGILYGPATWYARDALTSDEIRVGEIAADAAVTSFVHVADAARAALMALDWPAGPLNIVDDEPAPASEWVPVYARLIGVEPPAITSGAQGWERGASNARARGLGWSPLYPTWREGFKEALA